jgi:hypothetical protein
MKYIFASLLTVLLPSLSHAFVPVIACQKVHLDSQDMTFSFFAVALKRELAPGQIKREPRVTSSSPESGLLPILCFGYIGSSDPKKIELELSLWKAEKYASFPGFTCDKSNTDGAKLEKIQRKELGGGQSIQMPAFPGSPGTSYMLRVMTDDEYATYLQLGGDVVSDASIDYLYDLCEQFFP